MNLTEPTVELIRENLKDIQRTAKEMRKAASTEESNFFPALVVNSGTNILNAIKNIEGLLKISEEEKG